ncbi:putative clathrin assembly protein At1g03050 [Malania oleifera]|uniref:putative clathrin assembly protein At1g03050 n=1 Tax=Malania oleifera TaxID=397392 RepID=UPI0025ADAAF3|nr:putative clathrin assembly protein At1g03050 [Malania oleifera]
MAPSKIRRALGAVKDRTSIGLAKVGGSASQSDLDVAIVKATRHEEYPAEEKHIREILSLTSYSRAYISACVNTLSKRLNKTKNWTVALKTLILIQRLLAEGDAAYEQEIFFATRRGTRLLNMSDFRDASRSNSWDFSAFVRTYALYLDERLEFKMHGRRGKRSAFELEEEEDQEAAAAPAARATPVHEMRIDHIFSRTHHLQQLLERFLACRPTGAAKSNRVVIVALYPIVKESFQIYYDITEIMGILIDRFMELEVPDCVKVYDIFCRVGKEFDELDLFYSWCRNTGIARSSEYPEVEKITQKKLDIMTDFINDKSALQCRKNKNNNSTPDHNKLLLNEEDKESEPDDMNAIKALPAPEGFEEEKKTETEPKQEEEKVEEKPQQQFEADLLNLRDDAGAMTSEQHGDKLALALFDGGGPAASPQPSWEAFGAGSQDPGDWELALVQSASNLSGQQAALGGGFDMLLLDGMYQQGVASARIGAGGGSGATGSASSVALGSAGRPAMLALPAPPVSDGSGGPSSSSGGADPFAASLKVAPPSYVQMSEMEKKQKLLVEEQVMWQQYTRDGMQGQLGISKLQPNPYNMGGYHT